MIAALRDTSQWSQIEKYNLLRDTSDTNYRVPGASRIAAVILVSIEEPIVPAWMRTDDGRHARREIFVNEEAQFPLNGEQIDLLKNLDFNCVPYGPQWDTWEEPKGAWRDSQRILNRREAGRRISSSSVTNEEVFELSLPAEDVTRLLAGIETEAPLRTGVGYLFGSGVLPMPVLVRATFDEGDPIQRRAPSVRIGLLPRKRQELFSRLAPVATLPAPEFTPRERGFTVSFSAELLMRILSGHESAQPLADSLRASDAQGQLAKIPPIEAAEILPSRRGTVLRIAFGEANPRIVQGLKS